jgi:hypothetical protein
VLDSNATSNYLLTSQCKRAAGGLLVMVRKMETSKQQCVFLVSCWAGPRGKLIIEKNSSDERNLSGCHSSQSGPTKKPQLFFFFGPAQIFSKSSDVEVEKF